MKTPPAPMESYSLTRLLPIFREFLNYSAQKALESPDGLAYNAKDETITYYASLNDDDRSLFDCASSVEEVWVITGSGIGDS